MFFPISFQILKTFPWWIIRFHAATAGLQPSTFAASSQTICANSGSSQFLSQCHQQGKCAISAYQLQVLEGSYLQTRSDTWCHITLKPQHLACPSLSVGPALGWDGSLTSRAASLSPWLLLRVSKSASPSGPVAWNPVPASLLMHLLPSSPEIIVFSSRKAKT